MKMMSIGKMLAHADAIPKKAERTEFLHQNWSPALGVVLRLAYDPTIEWHLPAGRPEFKPSDVMFDMETALYNYVRKMYLFVKGPNSLFTDYNADLNDYKRQKIFVDVLENLPREDADLLLAAKDKTLPHCKRLTPKYIEEVFPGLLNLPVEKPELSSAAIPAEQSVLNPAEEFPAHSAPSKAVDYNT